MQLLDKVLAISGVVDLEVTYCLFKRGNNVPLRSGSLLIVLNLGLVTWLNEVSRQQLALLIRESVELEYVPQFGD